MKMSQGLLPCVLTTVALALGCGSSTPPPPEDTPELRQQIEAEDAAVHDAESQQDQQNQD